jgi:RNA polymerase sigma factor (sigma-70 family)
VRTSAGGTVVERDSDLIFADYISADENEAHKYEKALIDSLKGHAYAVCLLVLQQPRKDIVEEAIQKALTHAKTFRGESKFSTWFHAIVKNLCASAQKAEVRRRQRGEVSMEEMDDVDPDSGQNVEAQTSAKIDLDRLTEGMKEEEKQILHFKMQGMNEGEIAREMSALHGKKFTEQRVQRIFRRIKANVVDKLTRNIGE